MTTTMCYYNEVIETIKDTYPMLRRFYKLETGSLQSIELYQEIETRYKKIEAARVNYYTLLKKQGGDPQSCWLTDELENGLYCLDEKYKAIEDLINSIR